MVHHLHFNSKVGETYSWMDSQHLQSNNQPNSWPRNKIPKLIA